MSTKVQLDEAGSSLMADEEEDEESLERVVSQPRVDGMDEDDIEEYERTPWLNRWRLCSKRKSRIKKYFSNKLKIG